MGIVFYPDSRPGIARMRCGRGFTYVAADGTRVERGAERARLEAMAVPPAWERVWMTPRANGHLWATGVDGRARKQYRYHPDWSAARAEVKYDSLAAFGAALPGIRRAIARDLRKSPGDEAFAHAAALLLIDETAIRVGSDAYAAENGTYGATTLRRRHLRLVDGAIRLAWTGKGGRKERRVIRSRRLMRALQAARDLPGATLFTWEDENGVVRRVGSSSLNAWLADVGGRKASDGEGRFTAKTFRTWAGSLAAFELHLRAPDSSPTALAKAAAERLANTPTVARSSYIHPKIMDLAGSEAATRLPPVPRKGLSRAESAMLRLIE